MLFALSFRGAQRRGLYGCFSGSLPTAGGHGPDPSPNRTEGATGPSPLGPGEERDSQSLQSISPHPLPWFQAESQASGACASAFALPAWATVRVTPSPSRFWTQVIETKELVPIRTCQIIENKGVIYRDRRGWPPGRSHEQIAVHRTGPLGAILRLPGLSSQRVESKIAQGGAQRSSGKVKK